MRNALAQSLSQSLTLSLTALTLGSAGFAPAANASEATLSYGPRPAYLIEKLPDDRLRATPEGWLVLDAVIADLAA